MMAGQPPPIAVDTSVMGAPPPPTVIADPQTGEPKREAYFTRGQVDPDIQYRDALERWKPNKHRSAGQVVKEGLIGAANAVNANPNNPYAAVGGLGTGLASGGIQPNVVNRAYKLQRADEGVAHHLAEEQKQAQVANMGQVPVTLANGTTVYTTKAHAADLMNKQQGVAQVQGRLDEQKRRNDAYIGHVNDLPKERQSEAARKMYMSGIADGNDELKAELAKRMGLTEELPDSDKGSVQTDAKGNLTVVHTRRAGATAVTDDTTGAPVGSFKKTQEEGRNTRQAKQITAQDARQRASIAAAASRQAASIGDRQKARMLDRVAKASKIHGDALAGDELAKSTDATTRERGKAMAAQARKALVGYGDVYQVDAQGNAAPKQGAGLYEGQSMSRGKLPAAAQKLGITPEELEQRFISEGGKITEQQ
jgi:hypothetical protein